MCSLAWNVGQINNFFNSESTFNPENGQYPENQRQIQDHNLFYHEEAVTNIKQIVNCLNWPLWLLLKDTYEVKLPMPCCVAQRRRIWLGDLWHLAAICFTVMSSNTYINMNVVNLVHRYRYAVSVILWPSGILIIWIIVFIRGSIEGRHEQSSTCIDT